MSYRRKGENNGIISIKRIREEKEKSISNAQDE
jgi:hypothetical protein